MYSSLEDLGEPKYYLEQAVEQVPAKEPEPVKEVETEPEVVEAEPKVVAAEPVVVAAEPEEVAAGPEVVAAEPEVVAAEPEMVKESKQTPVKEEKKEEDAFCKNAYLGLYDTR